MGVVGYGGVGYEREIIGGLWGYVGWEVRYGRGFRSRMGGKNLVEGVMKVGVKF